MKSIALLLIAIPASLVHDTAAIEHLKVKYPSSFLSSAELADKKCLATMIYGEARGETVKGQVAVAYSAVNRAKHNKSVCHVVLEPKQYSVFNKNPKLKQIALSLHLQPQTRNKDEEAAWLSANRVAERVIKRKVKDPTNGSTHYYSPNAVSKLGYTIPAWSTEYKVMAMIDNHVFYKDKQ